MFCVQSKSKIFGKTQFRLNAIGTVPSSSKRNLQAATNSTQLDEITEFLDEDEAGMETEVVNMYTIDEAQISKSCLEQNEDLESETHGFLFSPRLIHRVSVMQSQMVEKQEMEDRKMSSLVSSPVKNTMSFDNSLRGRLIDEEQCNLPPLPLVKYPESSCSQFEKK